MQHQLSDEAKRAIEQATVRMVDTIAASVSALITVASMGVDSQIRTASERIVEEIVNAELQGAENAQV